MKRKNPFKKGSLTDTLVNVGIGGASNVAIDYVFDMLPAEINTSTTKNLIKVVGGAVVGGMINNKFARAAADGIAVVGVSNLISELAFGGSSSEDTKSPAGLPAGTIGALRPRVRLGNNYFKTRSRRISGTESAGDGFSVSKLLGK